MTKAAEAAENIVQPRPLGGAAPAGTAGGGFGGLAGAHTTVKTESGEETVARRFKFVNEENIKNLIYLLKKEAPEKVAIIISYLPSNISSYSRFIVPAIPGPSTTTEVALELLSNNSKFTE